ncbi:UDP-N-acetylglucosamine 2-epimerase (non-hydrolyzing) [Enterococcus cecorum]|uniref:non-hydrolyzing UDP-N-acetylglucosamine 2-epimerase n=1 Tax=Enterococcus cecorum TaxID=44008 RepID=UPI0032C3E962
MKIMVIFGTRPEAIKMCPVINALKSQPTLQTIVCLTGQHKEMLLPVMQIFDLKADYNLAVMQNNQTLSSLTNKLLNELDKVFSKEKPDLVLVHGDTTSAFVASLVAFYHQIPVGHVEAGLRTYDLNSPYPEEYNRQAIDLVSRLYFAPTDLAKKQLVKEGKNETSIFVTGNTVIDALKTTVKNDYKHPLIDWLEGSKGILLTTHRRENIGQPMKQIFTAVKRIVETHPDVKVVYPMHKNPKVREIAVDVFNNHERIKLIEPLDVVDFHNLMNNSYFIMTDSGGIQEEAPSLGKPVLVMRDTTERPEGVAAGTLKLVGTDAETIFFEADRLLKDANYYQKVSQIKNPYGDGLASKRIVNAIKKYMLENELCQKYQ